LIGPVAPPLLASLFKVAAALLGGWIILQQQAPRLAWPYGVVSASFVLGAIFIFWPRSATTARFPVEKPASLDYGRSRTSSS
jgi:hypothetical protein